MWKSVQEQFRATSPKAVEYQNCESLEKTCQFFLRNGGHIEDDSIDAGRYWEATQLMTHGGLRRIFPTAVKSFCIKGAEWGEVLHVKDWDF